jgi:arylsulfatase A-like enzyme
MRARLSVSCAFLFAFSVLSFADGKHGKAEHVVVVVWDGMRPDLVTNQDTPTLAGLARSGVVFKNNHCAYPSSTNVNGAVLATGVEPARTGIIANQEFRAEIDPRKPFDTADFPALDALDGRVSAQYFATPTIAEIIQLAGYRTAIAGSKPVAQLFDRGRRRETEAAKKSVVIYRGKVLPLAAAPTITTALGPFPVRKSLPNESEDSWTTRALTEVLWKADVPKFSLLWLGEPDLSEHATGPGSPTSRAAIEGSDENLHKILVALKAKSALTSTDILVVSDHGFSTVARVTDVAARLRAAGFDAVRSLTEKPAPGQILVVDLGGSVAFYVIDHDESVIGKLVDFLQHSDFAGVILTRAGQRGTFTLSEARVNAATAPDVLVACRWNNMPNEFGVVGEIATDIGRNAGQGSHGTLSSHDMNNLLIASGPDFRSGWTDETPSGNVDLAPTILWLLGMKAPRPMDGRVLREALAGAHEQPRVEEKTIETQRDVGDRVWRQHLRTATVDGVTYFLDGDGSPKSNL